MDSIRALKQDVDDVDDADVSKQNAFDLERCDKCGSLNVPNVIDSFIGWSIQRFAIWICWRDAGKALSENTPQTPLDSKMKSSWRDSSRLTDCLAICTKSCRSQSHCLTHTKYQWSQVHIVTAREWNALKTDCSSSYKFRRLLPIHRLCIDAVDLTGTALADFKRDEGSACDCTINHRIRCGKKTLEKTGCLFVVLSSQYFSSFGRRYWAQPCISNI